MHDSRTRLPPRVFDGKSLIRPGMKNARRGEPLLSEPFGLFHERPVNLATTPERAVPEHENAKSKRRESADVRGNGVIVKVSHHDAPKPAPLCASRLVHLSMQISLDRLKLGPHPVAARFPPEQKPSASRFAADMSKAEKRKCLGLP